MWKVQPNETVAQAFARWFADGSKTAPPSEDVERALSVHPSLGRRGNVVPSDIPRHGTE